MRNGSAKGGEQNVAQEEVARGGAGSSGARLGSGSELRGQRRHRGCPPRVSERWRWMRWV